MGHKSKVSCKNKYRSGKKAKKSVQQAKKPASRKSSNTIKKNIQQATKHPSPKGSNAIKKNVQQTAKSYPQGSDTSQEKRKKALKVYITMQVQHMCTKMENLWKCFVDLFYKRDFRMFTTLIIGIALIFVGGSFTFTNRIKDVPDWSKTGPAILIASDKPLCGAEIIVTTEDDGITTLTIREEEANKILSTFLAQHSGTDEDETQSGLDENEEEDQGEQVKASIVQQEEYHLWIYLNALGNIPIDWEIENQYGDVKNYELLQITPGNKQEFLARETDKSKGSDCITVFKITFGGGHFSLVQIRILEDPKHAAFSGNGIYRPRIPFVSAWYGYEQGFDYENKEHMDKFNERSRYLKDADLLSLTINNCPMYFPILKIESSYALLSLAEQHDLEIMWVSPESKDGYPLFWWTQYLDSFPVVQFRDKRWEINAKRNNLLGGIFVGLGINVLLTFSNLNLEKRKR